MAANIGTKETGIIIIVMAVALSGLLVSMTNELNATLHSDCACGPGVCPMEGNLPLQSYAGFSVTFILGGFGIYLVSKSRQLDRLRMERSERFRKSLTALKGEEKQIVERISSSDGVVFQSDLIEQLGLSKAKVSRILDRLEHMGLLERRRRGMSNIVLLKQA